jgi:hypothetical protein
MPLLTVCRASGTGLVQTFVSLGESPLRERTFLRSGSTRLRSSTQSTCTCAAPACLCSGPLPCPVGTSLATMPAARRASTPTLGPRRARVSRRHGSRRCLRGSPPDCPRWLTTRASLTGCRRSTASSPGMTIFWSCLGISRTRSVGGLTTSSCGTRLVLPVPALQIV